MLLDRFPKSCFLLSFLVFSVIAISSGIWGFDANRLNFIVSALSIFFMNPFYIDKRNYLLFVVSCFILICLLFFIKPIVWSPWLFLLVCLLGGVLGKKETKTYGRIVIFSAMFFVLSFLTNTPYGGVQYDWASCYNYMEYIYENSFLFWHENPLLTRPSYSAYHPILHFFLGALDLTIIRALIEFIGKGNFARDVSLETLQILTMFYMFWYYLLADKILKLFDFKNSTYVVSLSFLTFFPAYFAIAGYINNDCLLLPLEAGVIYYSLRWYKTEQDCCLWKIVLFSFLASMTKLSGVIVLPLTAVIFFIKLFYQKNLSLFIKLSIVGIFILLGISIWPLYQYFVLGVTFSFVPPQTHLSLMEYSVSERFNLTDMFFYKKIFYEDFGINLWETILKTALFQQWNFSYRGGDIIFLIFAMTYLLRIIVLLFVCGVVYLLFKKFRDKNFFYLMLVLLASIVLGEIMFILKHPYMCNQDFRYISIIVLPVTIIFAWILENMPKFSRYALFGVLGVFSFVSTFVWWWISF